MIRTISLTAAVTLLVGFVFGWLAFSNARLQTVSSVAASRAHALNVPERTVTVDVVQRYALRPADVSADRETTAIAVAPSGTIVLAWASQAEAGASSRTIYIGRSNDGGFNFGPPVAYRSVPTYKFTSGHAAQGRKMTFSTHVVPRLASARDGVLLGWVEAIDGGPEVKYLMAGSVDGGATFSEPIPVHGGDASRPGFTAMATTTEGTVACGWLDGRGEGQQPFFSIWAKDAGKFAPEQLVFNSPEGKGICPCCDLAIAVAPDGEAFVAFRNSDAGHRDIWVARRPDAGAATAFLAPVPVTHEPWTFDGCPHDGPSLALAGKALHVAWMDAHTGTNRVYHAASPVGDLSFQSRPLNLQGQGTQGHPRIATDGEGALHVVWDEGLGPEPPVDKTSASPSGGHSHHHEAPTAGGPGRSIMYAVSRDGGASFSPAQALSPSLGAYQTQPSLALGQDGSVNVAWSEINADGKHAVFARVVRPKVKTRAKAKAQAKEPRRP